MKVLTDQSRMPFGAHKDEPMEKVPAAYLLWLWEDGLWDAETLKATLERDAASGSQNTYAPTRLAVHRYIKDNFSALEKEKHDVIITHRPQ